MQAPNVPACHGIPKFPTAVQLSEQCAQATVGQDVLLAQLAAHMIQRATERVGMVPPAGAALQVSPHSLLVAQAPGPTNTPPQAPAADQSGITTSPPPPEPGAPREPQVQRLAPPQDPAADQSGIATPPLPESHVFAALCDGRKLRQRGGRAPRADVGEPSLVEQAPGPGHPPLKAPAAEPPPGGPQAQALATPDVDAPDTTTVPIPNFLLSLD